LVNHKLILALHLSCSGGREVKIILGILNLANNRMPHLITEIQQQLGSAILQVGKKVLQENLQLKKDLSPIGFEGKRTLLASNGPGCDKFSANQW
jgi:hypothetical protein